MRNTMPVDALAAPTISHTSTSAVREPPAPPCSTGTSRPSAPTPAQRLDVRVRKAAAAIHLCRPRRDPRFGDLANPRDDPGHIYDRTVGHR
jgi:hypothetical protein